MQLRPKQMNERRNRILDAAERLIRQTGGTDFSVRSLAAASEVSPATPFNLFGSKEGLLYALLSRTLDQIVSQGLTFKSADRSYHVIEAAEAAVHIFLQDPELVRPLYQVLLGVDHPVHRPLFMKRSLDFWRTAVDTIPINPALADETDRDDLAVSLLAHFIGFMELWVHEEVDDRMFRAHVIHGMILTIWSSIPEDFVVPMRRHLEAVKAELRASGNRQQGNSAHG